jgi:hypothetical protein
MSLEQFVNAIQLDARPVAVVIEDVIVEGVGMPGAGWTAELITAEAFHQDVISSDDETWESALAKVRAILAESV